MDDRIGTRVWIGPPLSKEGVEWWVVDVQDHELVLCNREGIVRRELHEWLDEQCVDLQGSTTVSELWLAALLRKAVCLGVKPW